MTCVYEGPNGRITFSQRALECFEDHRQNRAGSREAGGQLFSRSIGRDLVIDEATAPGRLDRRSRFSFWPHRQTEQRAINQMFKRGLHFVGDWHTHPQDDPRPSGDDIDKITAIFEKSRHRLDAMVLVIVGRQSPPDGLYVAHVTREGILECRPRKEGVCTRVS